MKIIIKTCVGILLLSIFVFIGNKIISKHFSLFQESNYDIFYSYSETGSIENEIETEKNSSFFIHLIAKQNFASGFSLEDNFGDKIGEIEEIYVNGEKQKGNIIPKENDQITLKVKASKKNKLNQSSPITKPGEENPSDEPNVPEDKTAKIQFQLKKIILLSDFNTYIPLLGTGLENVSYIIIGEFSFPVIQEKGNYGILIPKDTFHSGDYFVLGKDKWNNVVQNSQKVRAVFSNNQVNIEKITPNTVYQNPYTKIVLQGRGFSKIISIQLSNNVVLKQTDFEIISDNLMVVEIPEELQQGTYSLNVMSTNKIQQNISSSFTLIKK